MENSNNQQQRSPVANWFREKFGRFVDLMEDYTDRELNGVQAVLVAVAALIAGAGAVALAGWLLVSLVRLVVWTVGGHAADLGHALSALPVVHVATDPIGGWAARHAAGLPISANALLTVWAVGGGVLAVAGLAGARGARIAWPFFGAATAAMAWFGAAEPHRPVAAGLIVLAWGLASILVLRRVRQRPATYITNVLPGRDPEPVPPGPSEHPTGATPLTPIR